MSPSSRTSSSSSRALRMSPWERELAGRLAALKGESGSHSPSLATIEERIPELTIRVDACFLSNPYATDLFVERMTSDLVDTGKLRKVLEFYPSQNPHVALQLEPIIGVPREQIFACNGAIEAIQACMHRFAGDRVVVILPTFSPYYEFLRDGQDAVFYRLRKEDDFSLDAEDFIDFVYKSGADTVCMINPNNPNGGYVPLAQMRQILDAFAHLRLFILDESFIDFAYEDEQRARGSLALDAARRPNVVLIKSMSKDFGVAGLRAGYAVMSRERLRNLLRNGYLWNLSGLSEYFFRLFAERGFQQDYANARLRYLDEATKFFAALRMVPSLRTYPTKANFCLSELVNGASLEWLVPLLLIRHGVYVRDCSDKVGLDGEYLRIAGRKEEENRILAEALQDVLNDT